MDEDAEQQPVRVHRDGPLAPLQPFRRIPTTWAAALGGLDALGIDDGCRGAGVPCSAVAHKSPTAVANALPPPVPKKGAHMAVHGSPGRKGRRGWQMPPLAAGAHK